MALSKEITTVAELIAADLQSGQASRRSVGTSGVAFGWTSGLPVTIADFVTTAEVEGLSVPVTRVEPTGTPAAKVAAAGLKPTAVAVTSENVAVPKFSGLAVITIEQQIGAVGLLPAIVSALGAQALIAFEKDAVASIDAGADIPVTGADWSAALIAGQAAVLAAGGVPGLILISATDYAAVIGAIAGGAGFAHDPGSAIGSFMGSVLHVSPGAVAGKAFVMDPSAVVAFENVNSPVVLVDPHSQADTNQIRVVADVFAVACVTAGGLIAEVTVTP